MEWSLTHAAKVDPLTKKEEAPCGLLPLRRFKLLLLLLCTSYLPSVPVDPSLSAAFLQVKLSWGLNYPSPFWLKELQSNGKTVALHWLAVRYSSRGAKFSGARGKRQPLVQIPAAHTHHTRAARTHIFRKSRFRAGHLSMAVEQDGDLHGDPALDAVVGESVPVGFDWHSSS